MESADAFIRSFLEHAESDYYDPVKAHEYYERTKELSGRQSKTRLKTDAQRQGFSYVRSRVKEDKKAELDSVSAANKAGMEQIRATGKQRREALSVKMKQLFEKISTDVDLKIKALPRSLSKAERAIEIAKIRGAAQGERASTKEKGQGERAQIVGSLKSAVEDARSNYKQLREAIKVKYDVKLDNEFDAISNNVR